MVRNKERTTKSGIGKKVAIGVLLAVTVAVFALWSIPTKFHVGGYGNVLSASDAVLRAGSKGPVKSILVKSGDRVSKGNVVLALESDVERSDTDKCKRELDQARAEMLHLQELLAITRLENELEIEHAKIDRDDCLMEYEHIVELQKQQAASRREMRGVKAEYELARTRLKRLSLDRTALRKSQLEVQNKKIGTLQSELERAEGTLARRQIAAPLDGVIVLHALSLGQVVDANEVLGQIFDDRYYQVVARLPERYARYLRSGQTVGVRLSAYPELDWEHITGVIEWVSPLVTPHGSGDGTILIKARLTDVAASVALKSGMSAKVSVTVGRTRYLWRLIGLLPKTSGEKTSDVPTTRKTN